MWICFRCGYHKNVASTCLRCKLTQADSDRLNEENTQPPQPASRELPHEVVALGEKLFATMVCRDMPAKIFDPEALIKQIAATSLRSGQLFYEVVKEVSAALAAGEKA